MGLSEQLHQDAMGHLPLLASLKKTATEKAEYMLS